MNELKEIIHVKAQIKAIGNKTERLHKANFYLKSVSKRWKNCLKILSIEENVVLCIEHLCSTSASVT